MIKDPAEFAAELAESYSRHGADGLADAFHADVVYEEDPRWPGAGTFEGQAAVLARFREYEQQLGAGRASSDRVELLPGGLVSIFRHAGMTTGAGVPFEHRWAWVIRMRDGKAAHIRAYVDPDEAVSSAGGAP